MPITEDRKRQIVLYNGLSPNDYTTDEDGLNLIPVNRLQPSTGPETVISVSEPANQNASGLATIPQQPSSPFQTFVRSAIHAAPSAAGAGVGAGLGTAAGVALAPETGGLSLLLPLLFGTGSAIAGGVGTRMAQSALENEFVPPEQQQQFQQEQQQNPWAARLGNLATMPLGGFNPSPSNLIKAGGSAARGIAGLAGGVGAKMTREEAQNLANVGLGGAIGGGVNVGEQLTHGGEFDPSQLLEAVGSGLLFNKPNAIGTGILGFHPSGQPTDVESQLRNSDALQQQTSQGGVSTLPPGLSLDQVAAAGGVPLSKGIKTIPGREGKADVIKSTGNAMSGYKVTPEPVDVGTLENEGGRVDTEQQDLLQHQRDLEVEKQKKEDERLKKIQDLEDAQHQLQMQQIEQQTADLKAQIEQNRINSESAITKGTNPQRDFTRGTTAGNKQVAAESPADLQARQAEGLTDKYSEESKLKQQQQDEIKTQQESDLLQNKTAPKAATDNWFKIIKDWAATRGLHIDDSGVVTDSKGNEVAGNTVLKDGIPQLLKINRNKAGADTLPHELTHALIATLRRSGRPQDLQFVNRYDKLVSESPDYQQWAAARQKATGGPLESSPEEYQATNAGYEFVKRVGNADAETPFKKWYRDFSGYLKTRFGKHADEADYQRMLQYHLIHGSESLGPVTDPNSVNVSSGPITTKQQEESKIQSHDVNKDTAFEPIIAKKPIINDATYAMANDRGEREFYNLANSNPELARRLEDTQVKMPVYHKTNTAFERANPEEARVSGFNSLYGMHVGTVKAANERSGRAEDSQIQKLWLNLKHPYEVGDLESNTLASMGKKMYEDGLMSPLEYKNIVEKNYAKGTEKQKNATKALQEILKRAGYDGLKYENMMEDAGKPSYVAFDKSQLINAISQKRDPVTNELYSEQTKLPAFKEWFKDSKVVDKNGEPLVVYHGTNKDFSVFKPAKEGTTGKGIYVTPNTKVADYYSSESANAERRVDGSNVMPLFAKTTNPLEVNLSEGANPAETVLRKLGYSREKAMQIAEKALEEKGNITNELQSKAIAKGYDSILIRKEDGSIHEVNLFNPNQVKSAIGNKGTFDPNNPDIRYAQYSKMPIFKSQLDTIREKAGPEGEKIADAMERYFPKRDQVSGKGMAPIVRASSGMANSDLNKVEDVLIRENRDKQSYNQGLNNKQKNLYDAIRQSLLEKQQDQIAANQPVTGNNGVKRLPQVDPYYFPNRIDPKVADILNDPQQNVKSAALKQDFLTYQQQQGLTQTQAQSKLDAIIESYKHGEVNLAKFNANREAQGVGLPESWMRRGKLLQNLSSYYNRVASDRAYHDTIETNPDVAKSLGLKNDPWGNPITSNSEDRSGFEPVKALLDRIHGEPFDHSESQLKAMNRVASSLMLGPLTNAHIMGSSIFKPFESSSPLQAVKGATYALTHLNEGLQHALQTGYYEKNFTSFHDIIDAQNTGIEKLAALSNGIGKLSGRDAVDKLTKGYLQAYSEYLIKQKIVEANNGSKEAQNILEHIDPDYVQGKNYTPNEQINLASTFGSLIHGAHDARTLPTWMLKETAVQPFFQLASWNIAQTNQWMRHVWTPAKQGNFTPLIMSTLGSVLGGYVIKNAREAIADKKSPIPSLNELVASSKGWEGNLPLVGYNLIGMASYVGYAGILSTLAKAVEDVAHKNIPQGATFPLDEVLSNSATRISQAVGAFMNDPNADFFEIAPKLVADLAKENVQLARVGISWLANASPNSTEGMRKAENVKLSDLRRFKMAEGMPYDAQTGIVGNPYQDLGEKQFHRTQDLSEAVTMLPELMKDALSKSKGNPEILRSELQKIKSNSYQTMPDPDRTPMSFIKYVTFLNKTQPGEAQRRLVDYYRHSAINQVKSEMVPSL